MSTDVFDGGLVVGVLVLVGDADRHPIMIVAVEPHGNHEPDTVVAVRWRPIRYAALRTATPIFREPVVTLRGAASVALPIVPMRGWLITSTVGAMATAGSADDGDKAFQGGSAGGGLAVRQP